MESRDDWERVVITQVFEEPGMTAESRKRVITAEFRKMWAKRQIPVIGWEGPLKGHEIHPPATH